MAAKKAVPATPKEAANEYLTLPRPRRVFLLVYPAPSL